MSRVDMRFVAQELEFEATLQKDLKEDQEWRQVGQFDNETQNWPVEEPEPFDYWDEYDWRNDDLYNDFDYMHPDDY